MQMNYISEKNNFSNCILGIAFLSSLIYFAETIIIIQKPIEEYLSLEVKTNDTAIFYFFRQLNFIPYCLKIKNSATCQEKSMNIYICWLVWQYQSLAQ
ncbi:diguanylate cyclase [Klebsiella pneumoniae]|nr:diguanylate cyclase [Klebsiella pneumoniae]